MFFCTLIVTNVVNYETVKRTGGGGQRPKIPNSFKII